MAPSNYLSPDLTRARPERPEWLVSLHFSAESLCTLLAARHALMSSVPVCHWSTSSPSAAIGIASLWCRSLACMSDP